MKYIIANWKMNFPESEYLSFCARIESSVPQNIQLVIAPPSIILSELTKNFANIEFASQNISSISIDKGAYTGEVSSFLLSKAGIKYSIIGHSERRKNFNESNLSVFAKANLLLKNHITPIICIGEDAEVRKNGKWKNFINKQIEESVPATTDKMIIAYEPVWAIGTGDTATLEQIEEVSEYIHILISKLAPNSVLVYGGSVTGSNSSEICKIKGISGILVGGASLNLDEFLKILKTNA
jgi:triosephosphate isomerase